MLFIVSFIFLISLALVAFQLRIIRLAQENADLKTHISEAIELIDQLSKSHNKFTSDVTSIMDKMDNIEVLVNSVMDATECDLMDATECDL